MKIPITPSCFYLTILQRNVSKHFRSNFKESIHVIWWDAEKFKIEYVRKYWGYTVLHQQLGITSFQKSWEIKESHHNKIRCAYKAYAITMVFMSRYLKHSYTMLRQCSVLQKVWKNPTFITANVINCLSQCSLTILSALHPCNGHEALQDWRALILWFSLLQTMVL